ncbi:Phosphatidylinositol-bisphosphatase [Fasciola hepatica]|uniref:Phosphatidylinositol-bisphosphatase n=1 Tax=Fasciola hepatica TaxID=6192 RepID=A0A4E0R205_FASHE|nr:Phosphatidylinositol-bisphosphatase [Fasciola hepatica]
MNLQNGKPSEDELYREYELAGNRLSSDASADSVSGCGLHLRPAGSIPSIRSVYTPRQNDVKSKSYLVGSPSTGCGTLLGSRELSRIFPNHSVNVEIVTWNMNCPRVQKYPEDLSDLIFPSSMNNSPSIFAICLQEIPPEKQELLVRLQAAIGPQHVLFSHAFHGTLALAVFVSRELIWYTSVPQVSAVTTRTAVRTKGAVAVCFILFGTSMLFLSSHFKASQDRVNMRVQDYQDVVASLNLPKIGLSRGYRPSENLLNRFDIVFWAGDLNFRIDRSRAVMDNVLRSYRPVCTYDNLSGADQLTNVQAQGRAFQAFEEGRIKFLPTYKFDLDSTVYDTSDKQRVPAYTDRILYKTRKKGDVTCANYDSIDSIRCSDHRPVYGVYSVVLKPGCDSIALAAGLFHRDVYIAGNQRRALRFDLVRKSRKRTKSKVCLLQ